MIVLTDLNAALTPEYRLPDKSYIHLLPSTCFLYRRIVASLLPVYCRIVDTKGYKSTVIVISNYVPEIQSTCIPDEQLVSGNMCPSVHVSGYKLLVRDTCFRATLCVLV